MEVHLFPDFDVAVIEGVELLKSGKVNKLHLYLVSSLSTDCCLYVLSSCNFSNNPFYPHSSILYIGEMCSERGEK